VGPPRLLASRRSGCSRQARGFQSAVAARVGRYPGGPQMAARQGARFGSCGSALSVCPVEGEPRVPPRHEARGAPLQCVYDGSRKGFATADLPGRPHHAWGVAAVTTMDVREKRPWRNRQKSRGKLGREVPWCSESKRTWCMRRAMGDRPRRRECGRAGFPVALRGRGLRDRHGPRPIGQPQLRHPRTI